MRRVVAALAAGGGMLTFGVMAGFAAQPDHPQPVGTPTTVWVSPPASVAELGQVPDRSPGAPTTATQGVIAIVLGAPAFAGGQPIAATIVNGLDHAVYTQDQKTDCSIAYLERWDGASWQPIAGCGLRRLARVYTIAPGASEVVAIDPASAHLAGAASAGQPAIGPGAHRLRFTYSLDPNTVPGTAETEETPSVQFSIGQAASGGQPEPVGGTPAMPVGFGAIAGEATRGPTCGGAVREGQVCEEPVQVTIDVRDQAGQVVAHFQTDTAGRFQVPLPPGAYTVEATRPRLAQPESPRERPRISPAQVTITAGAAEQVHITIDTGIR